MGREKQKSLYGVFHVRKDYLGGILFLQLKSVHTKKKKINNKSKTLDEKEKW